MHPKRAPRAPRAPSARRPTCGSTGTPSPPHLLDTQRPLSYGLETCLRALACMSSMLTGRLKLSPVVLRLMS